MSLPVFSRFVFFLFFSIFGSNEMTVESLSLTSCGFFCFLLWLQTCLKYCSQDEKDVVFKELHPHFLSLASNTYAVHVLQKMLDGGEN